MNKSAIQSFAIWARTELISQVSQRAYQYDITADGYGDYDAEAVGGRLLSNDEKKQRQQLINQIRSKGYTQVMEEIAYTWFNRFIALRFMEVNNYLPTHIRVFSDASGAFKPEILSNALHLDLDGLDMEKVSDLIEKNQSEDLYRYLLLTQCNALSVSLPRMFENMGSYTELLLPNNILRQDSVLGRMVTDIPEEDWTDQVQIIGWLYQYYNTELKDDTFALLKKNVKVTKERIPSATQLFTPDWIVRYMVENSLGRLWIEGHPDDDLKAGWKYYLNEAKQEADVQAQLEAIRAEYRTLRPQDIKMIDPCMGSGHILVYAFDVLIQIYKKAGFSERDAAQSILKNNLYGLDIDDRAAQLAYFAVMMKARQYDRRIFTRNIQPHVFSIMESNNTHISAKWRLGPEQNIADTLIDELKDAKEYGSILNLSLTLDELTALRKRLMEIDEMSTEGNLMDMMESAEILDGLLPLIDVAEVMTTKYDIVVTNPPYMGLKNMSAPLFNYVMKKHPTTKNDLYGVFIQTALEWYAKKNGFVAMITQHVWMFTSGFEKYRSTIFDNNTIFSLVHLGTRAFEEISGEVVQTCAFVIQRKHFHSYHAKYVRLVNELTATQKEEVFLSGRNIFTNSTNSYDYIPGHPICYWLSDKVFDAYKTYPLVSDVSSTRQGLKTSDDKRFIRFIFEVDQTKIAHNINSIEQAAHSGKKWFWLNKGGQDKWYGNNIYLINWENDGAEVKDYATKVAGSYSKNITAIDAYFKECLSWPQISISHPSFRHIPAGYIFASAGPSLFVNDPAQIWYFLGFLNSCVTQELLDAINPTINFGVSDILKLPFFYSEAEANNVSELVRECVELTKTDWDSFEISWDFKVHPLAQKGLAQRNIIPRSSTISECYRAWESECKERFQLLKKNEIKLNSIFINIYGLQDELTPGVKDQDVDVRRADLERDIRTLISYAVGCMFGRYSLDTVGLTYAGGEWDSGKYKTYFPDKDNIIPICDDEYFDDDITGRFVKWVEVVFGKETLEENLKYIADALGGKGTPREVIRSYFLNDFYADHLKTYQKRPIYWLFDSGKKNGFKALIYMHRYQSDLLARMRTDYVHEQQERYRTQLKHIGDAMDSASASERVKLAKQQKKLQEQALELQKYEEKVHHLADQNIKIDLDDGVVHNYELFADVLAKRK